MTSPNPMALDAKALEGGDYRVTPVTGGQWARCAQSDISGAAMTWLSQGIAVRVELWEDALPPPAAGEGLEPVAWRCFHCDEVFTDEQAAREHFGFEQSSDPACRIKVGAERSLVKALREAETAAEDAVHKMHDESTEGYRIYYAAQSRFNAAVQAAEEAGYERGLADGRALGPALSRSTAPEYG